jgi:hypothetical protein
MEDIDEMTRDCLSDERAQRLSDKHYKNSPKNPWEAEIDIYLNAVHDDGTADFDVQTCLPTELIRADPHPRIHFYNDGRDGFYLTFRLFDNTPGGNYQFASDPDDAVWSQLGDACPSDRIYGVFDKRKTDVKGPTTLSVYNPNKAPFLGTFRYTLNVSVNGEAPYVALDPGGNNMNGTSGRGWR